MRPRVASGLGLTQHPRKREQAGARPVVLLLVGCLAGIAISAFLFHAASRRGSAASSGQSSGPAGIVLSDGTKAVLARLESPLEIRFYSLLDPGTVQESLNAFAGRVGRLLSAYEQQAGGKIRVTHITGQGSADANAALADGISVFNLDKGDACYLGVTAVQGGRKETLARLSPQWEQALEPDLTRAIGRLVDASQPALPAKAVAEANTNAIHEVKALIPDVSAVSLQAGRQILQDAALKEYTAAAKEMQTRLKEAEQRLIQAQQGGTEAEQQAAMKQLQQVQAEQTEKLKDIAAKAKAQVDTFEQLKGSSH